MSDNDGWRDWVRAAVTEESAVASVNRGSSAWLSGLCRVAVRTLPTAGVGISVMGGSRTPVLTATSDEVSDWVEELQFTLGEGPCLDAYTSGDDVMVPDLSPGMPQRWPAYALAAQGLGVQAVFAFPMTIGVARLGVMDVYRERAGQLSRPTVERARAFADEALSSLLDAQETTGDDGTLEVGSTLTYRLEVYQAQGMVQVQLGVGPDEAMARMRALAYANDLRMADIARQIVARQLTLERDDPDARPGMSGR